MYYRCSGAVMAEASIKRKVKRVGTIAAPCPAPVAEYQPWIGGSDVHDQLQLWSGSLQTST